VEESVASSGFFSSDVVVFLSWDDATTNLLTLARALHYTAYSVERSSTSPRRTIFDGYSPKCLEGPRVLKHSLGPVCVLGTGWGDLRRLHEWTLGLWGK
jgi:hypothetical protein